MQDNEYGVDVFDSEWTLDGGDWPVEDYVEADDAGVRGAADWREMWGFSIGQRRSTVISGTQVRSAGAGVGDLAAGRLLREVFAVEDVADTGVVEHRTERFCDQRRNRKDFDIRELLLGRERQRVGQDDLFKRAVLEPIDSWT